MTPAETGETRRTMDDTPSQVKHPTTIIVDGEVKEPISSTELVYDGRSSMKGPYRRSSPAELFSTGLPRACAYLS